VFNDPAAIHLAVALQRFTLWLPNDCKLWGNGASFDNAILANAYAALKMEQPWAFWNDRCYRTIKAMHPKQKQQHLGTHHNALDDAISQAEHLIAIAPGVL
jgi:exodeoxyribonuclease VIII